MNTTKTIDPFRTTYHRDGDVTLWDVFRQQWLRVPAANVSDEILATLSPKVRDRIERMAQKDASR